MAAVGGNQRVADAAAAGDHKKALKALEDLRWGYHDEDAAEVLEQVAREAGRIATAASGRIAKRAEKLAAGARETAEFKRRERQREATYEASRSLPSTAAAETGYAITPVSLGIGLVSAALMLISVFLPHVESGTFATVEKNTLIQSGDGWIFILLAVAIAGAVWRAYYSDRRSVGTGIFGLIAIGVAIYDGTNKSALTLCPVSPAATQLGVGCSTASPGVGIYMAGVAGALAAIAAWQIWRSEEYVPTADDERVPEANEVLAIQTAVADAPRSLEDRLRTLQKLKDDGLIDDSEYLQRRSALLDTV
jgi:hypothetical protein